MACSLAGMVSAQSAQYPVDGNVTLFTVTTTSPRSAGSPCATWTTGGIFCRPRQLVWSPSTNVPLCRTGQPVRHRYTGAVPEERAMHFLQTELNGFGMQGVQLAPGNARSILPHDHVSFRQQYEGLDVLFSNATLRMTPLPARHRVRLMFRPWN